MNILVTGGSGQLGEFINVEFSKSGHKFLTVYNTGPGNSLNFPSIKLDLTDYNSTKRLLKTFHPDAVIHTAAVSNAAKCDALSKAGVLKVNVEATGMLASLCRDLGSRLIFTSTDLVYDGKQGSMLTEDAALNPLSLYAESKLEAEETIKKLTGNYVILRTALLFGIGITGTENYFNKVYNSFFAGKKMELFTDQFRTPLALCDAARLIRQLVETNVKCQTVNFGGSERVSRAGLGEMLCEAAGFDKSLIREIKMEEISFKNNVPDVSMDNSKLKSFGIIPEHIEDSIKKIVSLER